MAWLLGALGCMPLPSVQAQSVPGLALGMVDESPANADLLNERRPPSAGTDGRAPDSGVDTSARALATVDTPFGANLFRGGFSNDREDGLNPGYVVQPGDRVTVRIWGAIEFDERLTVDARGNIFIPKVGPVPIGGTRNADLNTRVTQSVRSVFTDNVRVYTSLDGAQPVAVFVTGYVPRPGRFSGIPSNSPLHFIDRAGGIDAARGSYREVRVLRDGEPMVSFDLYDFLLEGALPRVQFRDGDTIVVGARGGTVAVSGDIAEPAVFELVDDTLAGAALADAALTLPGVSHVGVSGVRNGEPFSRYLRLDEFEAFSLQNGDSVSFRRDVHDSQIVVEIEGAHLGPSRFAVPRDMRLQALLDHVEVDEALSDISSISLRRVSIAEHQKRSIEDSLRRLEARYLTASSRTDAEARIRSQEAQLIRDFVERASSVEPSGRLVVAGAGGIADVLLEAGDVITIPRRSDSILLSGEVLVSQATLYREGLRARDYIARAGGFTEQALTDRIVVIHADGEVASGRNPDVRPGDELIVLPRAPVKNLQLAATVVDILYKVAVAAAVAINL